MYDAPLFQVRNIFHHRPPMTQRRTLLVQLLTAAMLAAAFPVLPTTAAPVQNNAARVWTDTFTDTSGVTLVNTVLDAPNDRIVLDRTATTVSSVATSVPVAGTARKVAVAGNRA